jgi:hypothetical protein
MSRSEESRNREQCKPILHIAASRYRPAFSPIAEQHESENARPFSDWIAPSIQRLPTLHCMRLRSRQPMFLAKMRT